MSPPGIYQDSFVVRTREVNCQGHVRLSALADYLQESAARHTTSLGIGPFQLKPLALAWVLSRLRIDMIRHPGWGERVQVTTWPKGERQVVANRDFELRDQHGDIIGRATSQWFLLDTTTMSIRSLDQLPRDFPVSRDSGEAIAEPPEKLAPLKNASRHIDKQLFFSDLDLNNHLNNTGHIDWVTDILPGNPRISSLRINYLNEIKLESRIRLSYAQSGDNRHQVEGIDANNRPAFRALAISAG